MKKIMISLVAAAIAAGAIAAAKPEPRKASMTRDERKAMAQRMMLERTGGFVIRPGTMMGKVVYVNGQTKVAKEVIDAQLAILRQMLRIELDLVDGPGDFSLKDVMARKRAAGANAAIFFVDDPTLADSMLVAPETGWAVVNFAKLAEDKPAKEVLEKRAVRETWRVFAQLLGAANSTEPKCVMRPVYCVEDLDALVGESFCPEPLDKIVENLKAAGVEGAVQKTYRQACEEGWAAEPTNEYQKVVWERVKAEQSKEPTKGMKIKYDPAAGK